MARWSLYARLVLAWSLYSPLVLAWSPYSIIHFVLPVAAQYYASPTVWNSTLTDVTPYSFSLFHRALPLGSCSDTEPCENGSCCNGVTGYCGYDPEHCAKPDCVSNCNATAECGPYAEIPGATCPLNVCCDKDGYCGTTSDFCDTDPTSPGGGCISNCVQPSATSLSNGNVTSLVIGYFNSQAVLRRGCAQRDVSSIRTDSITHLYVAFGYPQPDTYDIAFMPGVDEDVMTQIMNLKANAPGLRIYISLGGWDCKCGLIHSDNDTDTQAVFGDLASTAAKRQTFISTLATFMRTWGFDGVDIDWEYPGAPDRGGQVRDIENYVSLLSDMRDYFDTNSNGWGISFTAPTSYYYLRWFDIGNLTLYADWVNLMTYDLHGSWDSPEDDIGSYVYAHTNLTEISETLDLLWRNDVPANKVNLGLGFYGRSYTLSDPKCTSPGCPFTSGGVAGECTGTSGILSYDEIEATIQTYGLTAVYDKTAGVKYLAWNHDQWVSFDDAETFKQKVEYADQNGLLGLLIWSLDLDTLDSDALAAVLSSAGGLGAFQKSNGVGVGTGGVTWSPSDNVCFLGGCSEEPSCSGPYNAVGESIKCDSTSSHRRYVCCPATNTPVALTCNWRGGDRTTGICSSGNSCNSDEIDISGPSKYWYDGGDGACVFGGSAELCCSTSETATSACQYRPSCITINDDGQPDDPDSACLPGTKFLTYSQGSCPLGKWQPWCCDEKFEADCSWATDSRPQVDACKSAQTCGQNQINMGTSFNAEGSECVFYTYPGFTCLNEFGCTPTVPNGVDRALCCNAGSVTVFSQTVPVELDWLFPTPGPSSDTQSFEIDLDTTITSSAGSTIPDDNAFGWHILSGPEDEQTTLDKRDGSHWELYGCDLERHELRQTVQAVCTNGGEDSNCGIIWKGGVEGTVVELPDECGAGRYAMAVSLEPARNQTMPPHLARRLSKRGVLDPLVYDFTFDYDFSPLQRRAADSNVLIRIDYSQDPGYWDKIVDASYDSDPTTKRALRREIDSQHGGSTKRWLQHKFRQEKRATPQHELHMLHERWFSADLDVWLAAMLNIDKSWTPLRHSIDDSYIWYLFNEKLSCSINQAPVDMYFAAWAEFDVNVETSSTLTLIGNMGDLSSFQQSHVLFRSKGSIQASLNFDAFAQVSFSTGSYQVLGADNFGATFGIPGIVTIGPNFKILMELSGTMSIHSKATLQYQFLEWDYTQQYPNTGQDVKSGITGLGGGLNVNANADDAYSFYADIGAEGSLTASITPLIELGIVFASNLGVPSAAIDLGLQMSATIYGSAFASTEIEANVCYGINGGVDLYASIQAPTLFNYDFNTRYSIFATEVALLEETCYSPTALDATTCDTCDDAPES